MTSRLLDHHQIGAGVVVLVHFGLPAEPAGPAPRYTFNPGRGGG